MTLYERTEKEGVHFLFTCSSISPPLREFGTWIPRQLRLKPKHNLVLAYWKHLTIWNGILRIKWRLAFWLLTFWNPAVAVPFHFISLPTNFENKRYLTSRPKGNDGNLRKKPIQANTMKLWERHFGKGLRAGIWFVWFTAPRFAICPGEKKALRRFKAANRRGFYFCWLARFVLKCARVNPEYTLMTWEFFGARTTLTARPPQFLRCGAVPPAKGQELVATFLRGVALSPCLLHGAERKIKIPSTNVSGYYQWFLQWELKATGVCVFRRNTTYGCTFSKDITYHALTKVKDELEHMLPGTHCDVRFSATYTLGFLKTWRLDYFVQ